MRQTKSEDKDMADAHEVTDAMISDILCAAFEAGSTYWLSRVDWLDTEKGCTAEFVDGSETRKCHFASDHVAHGGTVILTEDDAENDEPFQGPLTRDMIAKGIRKAADLGGYTVERYYEEHDAEFADVALQLAIFGEVIYG